MGIFVNQQEMRLFLSEKDEARVCYFEVNQIKPYVFFNTEPTAFPMFPILEDNFANDDLYSTKSFFYL